ncbi:MAG: hypothetical protein U0Z75_10515 [Deinococcaceae bacterium]
MIRVNLLPKNLRRRVEPGWWKLLAVGVPVLALAVAGVLQVSAQNESGRLQSAIDESAAQYQAKQSALGERSQLLAQQQGLNSIISVAQQLKGSAGTESWSQDLERFVSRIPALGGENAVALNLLEMRLPQAQTAGVTTAYAGKSIAREISLSGNSRSNSALTRFIRSFEVNPDMAISFSSANKSTETGDWSFSAVVGLAAQATPVAVSTSTDGQGTPSPSTSPSTVPPTSGGN